MGDTDLLLHGFAGTGASWDPVIQAAADRRWRPQAPDLPGHGPQPRAPEGPIPVTAAELARRYAPVRTLAGYSMGGRLALQVALDRPAFAERLVLVSCSAGIQDPEERTRRREADDLLAGRFEAMEPDEVADLWLAGPLFAHDPPVVQGLARRQIVRNDPAALAAALRALGPGAMEPLWDRLGELALPVTILAGERDRAYVGLAERMAGQIAGADVVVVAGAGHGLLREAPGAVADAVLAGR